MGYGHGVDPQDKGAGKATTYALKNCLLYTFLTPVGKIDDTDKTHSDEIPSPPKSTLKQGSETWNKAVKYLKEGGDIGAIVKKYQLSEVEQNKMIDDANRI
jgi:hypothetical protein